MKSIIINGKYALYVKIFDATKTVWDEEDKYIIGYDGKHIDKIMFFSSKAEASYFVETASEDYGSRNDGSTFYDKPINFTW